MALSSSIGTVFRFGPYEFRPQRWELRKFGTVQKLQPQPARLLALFLSQPGKVISREEIQQTVWGDDVNVDYELGVNRCIRQIRSVLVDDPESPRYIKTIPRLGYSFIAAVEELSETAPETPAAQVGLAPAEPVSAVAHLQMPPFSAEARPLEAAPVGRFPRMGRLHWLALPVAGILIGVGIWEYLLRPTPIPVVTGYSQLTGDSYGIVIKTGDLARPISTDGSRVYFSVMTGAARSAIAQVSESGGEVSLLPLALPSPILLDLAPRRSEMLLASGGPEIGDLPLWVQPIPSGSPRRFPDLRVHGAGWSPAGDRIVYASGNSLYLVSASSGAEPALLAHFDPARKRRPYWPRWSGDGSQIRFSLYDGIENASSLWEISPAGGQPSPLLTGTDAKRDNCCGSWTPDGKYYLYASTEAKRSDIWALPARTGFPAPRYRRPVQLTAGPISYSAPTVSADGRTLFVIGNSPRGEVVRYDSGSRDFVPLSPIVSATQADVSRDGRSIAFVSLNGTIWRARSDGSARAQVSFSPLTGVLPRWSPDGSSIAFYGGSRSEPTAVYIASENAPLRKISLGAGHGEADPDWSADATKLVFSDTVLSKAKSSIQIVDLRTGHIDELPGSAQLRSPRWSPDGRLICALTADLHSLLLYDVASHSKSWKPLARFRMGYPNWSHDSRYLYVVQLSDGSAIARIRVSDGAVQQVVMMAHRNQYWTSDAWLGLLPDDTPLLSRDISIQEIYALRIGTLRLARRQ